MGEGGTVVGEGPGGGAHPFKFPGCTASSGPVTPSPLDRLTPHQALSPVSLYLDGGVTFRHELASANAIGWTLNRWVFRGSFSDIKKKTRQLVAI